MKQMYLDWNFLLKIMKIIEYPNLANDIFIFKSWKRRIQCNRIEQKWYLKTIVTKKKKIKLAKTTKLKQLRLKINLKLK